MGDFSADWLALREAADHRSRSADLAAQIASHVRSCHGGGGPRTAVRIVDLGAGTGSNVRYLAPRLPMPQAWCLIDRDIELLRELPKRLSSWALDRGATVAGHGSAFEAKGGALDCRFDARLADLSRLGESAAVDGLFDQRTLVTASALLDLVSAAWIETLVVRCRDLRAAVLFVLTYDGRVRCSPEDDDDDWIRSLVNRHQHGAKGFGRALGPDATAWTVGQLQGAGYEVRTMPSDWVLTSADAALQRPLIEGWIGAAGAVARKERSRVEAWGQRRLAHLDSGASQITVGHQDVAAWPSPQTQQDVMKGAHLEEPS